MTKSRFLYDISGDKRVSHLLFLAIIIVLTDKNNAIDSRLVRRSITIYAYVALHAFVP